MNQPLGPPLQTYVTFCFSGPCIYHLLIELYPLVPLPPPDSAGFSDYTSRVRAWTPVTLARAKVSFDYIPTSRYDPEVVTYANLWVVCSSSASFFRAERAPLALAAARQPGLHSDSFDHVLVVQSARAAH